MAIIDITNIHVYEMARIIVGIILIYYGYPKFKDIKKTCKDMGAMGYKPGKLWGPILILAEFFGGIAILAGFYVEIFALIFAFQMVVGTFWKIKIKKGFPDYSYDIMLFVLCLALVIFSPGAYQFAFFDLGIMRFSF